VASNDGVLHRTAARVLLTAPNGATLLVHGHDPGDVGRGGFYWTPGGGLDPGESLEEGARREVFEEVGHEVGDLGPVVLHRVGEFPFGGRNVRQTESFFLISVPEPFSCAPEHLSELEQRAIHGFIWLTPNEMRAAVDQVYPECLPDLIEACLRDGHPDPPWHSD